MGAAPVNRELLRETIYALACVAMLGVILVGLAVLVR